VPGFGSGLVAVQGPDFGASKESVMSTPNHCLAEDRENELNSAPKRLMQGTEGDLARASLDELRGEWRRLYRCEPPRISRDLLVRGIAYRRQEIEHGGLGQTTRRKLKTLAKMFRTTGRVAPDPGLALKPGARLVREWRGRTHTVTVTEDGSLSNDRWVLISL